MSGETISAPRNPLGMAAFRRRAPRGDLPEDASALRLFVEMPLD